MVDGFFNIYMNLIGNSNSLVFRIVAGYTWKFFWDKGIEYPSAKGIRVEVHSVYKKSDLKQFTGYLLKMVIGAFDDNECLTIKISDEILNR